MNHYTALRDCNNHAAALIVSGKYKQAIQELKEAVDAAADFLEKTQTGVALTRKPIDIMPLSLDFTFTDTMFPWPITALDTTFPEAPSEASCLIATCAVAIFNMGLACHHISRRDNVDIRHQRLLLSHAEVQYVKACEIGAGFDMNVLNLAVSTNLMDISFEKGDLTALHFWGRQFYYQIQNLSDVIPSNVYLMFCQVHIYYTGNLVAARAA